MSAFRVNKNVFRSYDVRGAVPEEMDETTAYAIGKAFARFNPATAVAVGYDHRDSSPALRENLVQGLLDSGVDVIDLGQVMTDMTYFATWNAAVQGAVMITASHMPAKFNGFKFITKDLQPIGQGSGMEELLAFAAQATAGLTAGKTRGKVSKLDVLQPYLDFVASFIDTKAVRPLRVVVDCGNGVAGPIVREAFKRLPIEVIELCFTPDARFPNHEANPIEAHNRKDIEAAVVAQKADLGIAFDADADRCYLIDERGQFVHGDFLTALLAKRFLQRSPGASIVYDVRASLVVPHTVATCGGTAHVERVGHSHIKRRMRAEQAVFGGEVSGHFYFADNKYMDNGLIPAYMALELLSTSDKPLSQLIGDLGPYFVSGEINSKVADQKAALKRLHAYAWGENALTKTMDGLSMDFADWRFNVRPSANEPVLRLNLEAKTQKMMEEKRDAVLALIRA